MSDPRSPDHEYVKAALQAWAPGYPRRVTKYQVWATSRPEAVELLLGAERDPNNGPFISTYAFPNGHTKNDAIPCVNRLFIDMDIPGDGEYRTGTDQEDAWIRDMSRLLVRVRAVAKRILNTGSDWSWQAALSGHKGVHLDLVFPQISASNGNFNQFHVGMATYANSVVGFLKDETNIDDLDEYVDVSSADMGRMRRVPNTLHCGAAEAFGEDRFCVPVTLRELAELTVSDYIELTRSRRRISKSMRANPNDQASTALIQKIRTANTGTGPDLFSGSGLDRSRIDAYKEKQNESIGVDDLSFVLSDRPCVLAFVERPDAFSHHSASHLMEMKAITEMAEKDVPIPTMLEFFSQADGYREEYTKERIEQYISRDYNAASCQKIWHQADQFCLGSDCQIWIDEQTQ